MILSWIILGWEGVARDERNKEIKRSTVFTIMASRCGDFQLRLK